jgi:hypothetical protein
MFHFASEGRPASISKHAYARIIHRRRVAGRMIRVFDAPRSHCNIRLSASKLKPFTNARARGLITEHALVDTSSMYDLEHSGSF